MLGENTIKGFKERQELYEIRKKEKQQRYTSDEKCTFKPAINFVSEILVESDPIRSTETNEDRIRRLSQKNPKTEEKLKKTIHVIFHRRTITNGLNPLKVQCVRFRRIY